MDEGLRDHGILLDEIDIYRREGMSGPASVRDIFLEKGFPAPDDSSLAGLWNSREDIFPLIQFLFLKESGRCWKF
jgi:hypothetical protein